MFFLLLPDLDAFLHFPGQQVVRGLGVLLAPLHQLHREGKAQNPGQELEFENLLFLRLQLQSCVLFPDFVVRFFLPGQPQEGLPVSFPLGKSRDLGVDDAFRQFVLLHLPDHGGGLRGNGPVHDDSSFSRVHSMGNAGSIISHPDEEYNIFSPRNGENGVALQ